MPALTRRRLLAGAAVLPALVMPGCATPPRGAHAPERERLAPFRPAPAAARGVETGLPGRVAWANTSDTEIFVSLGLGMRRAADDRGLEYLTANAAGDPAANIDQIDTFLARGVGLLGVQPLDPVAQAPSLRRAIDDGVCVAGIITAPSVLQVAAAQYEIGFLQGRLAAEHVVAELGGEAEVAYFNHDHLAEQLAVRHRGVLDGLATGGEGVRVVSDVAAPDRGGALEGGFAAMSSIIQAHPRIRVVLGGDTVTVGAYRALQETGRLRDDMYLAGVDGDSNALDLVAQGGPYRASHAFPWRLVGYALGSFGADWIEGRPVPRVVQTRTVLVDGPEAVRRYERINSDPAALLAVGGGEYLSLLGTCGYDDRARWQGAYQL